MNIPLPVVFILFVFLLPGFFALFFYSRRYDGSVPRDLNWGYGTVLVILFSGITHFVLAPVAFVIREVDVPSILFLAAGSVESDSVRSVSDSIVHSWGWMGLYSIASWSAASGIGWMLGRLTSRFIPPRPADKLFVSEEGVWTIVDILADPSTLYRGVYHSHRFPTDHQDGYLNIYLVSRWSGIRKEIKDPPEGSFKAVRRTIVAREIIRMIRDDLAASSSLEEANSELEKALGPEATSADIEIWISKYLGTAKRPVPQLSIPWSRVKNVNLRQFETRKPTMEENALL